MLIGNVCGLVYPFFAKPKETEGTLFRADKSNLSRVISGFNHLHDIAN